MAFLSPDAVAPGRLIRLAFSLLALSGSTSAACNRGLAAMSSAGNSAVHATTDPAEPAHAVADSESGDVSLLPLLPHGAIDVSGPVVDLGEPQAGAYVLPPLPFAS